MQCFQVLNSSLSVFSKIVHCNYGFVLNLFYFHLPSPISPQKIYIYMTRRNFYPHLVIRTPPIMLLNLSTLLGKGEYITWVFSRYNHGRLNITMPKKEYRVLVWQDNNTSCISANFCERSGYLLPFNQ